MIFLLVLYSDSIPQIKEKVFIVPKDYTINEGDMLRVSVYSKSVKVWDYSEYVDGKGYFPILINPTSKVGKIKITGLDMDSAGKVILNSLKRYVPSIDFVSLDLIKPSEFYVYVYGNVKVSGPLRVSSLTRLSDIILGDNVLPFSALSRIVFNGKTLSLWNGLRGDLENNPLLKNGDSIFIPKTDSIIYIRGFFTNGLMKVVEYNFGDRVVDILWKSGYSHVIDQIFEVKVNGKKVNIYENVHSGDTLEFSRYPNYISVVGEVRNPMSVEYKVGLTVADYINLAGGFTDRANRKNISVKRFKGNKFIKVPLEYEPSPGDAIYVGRVLLTYSEILSTLSFLMSAATFAYIITR